MEPPQRLPWQQVSNVLLYNGKYLCNNQIARLAQFIDTCFYNKKMCPTPKYNRTQVLQTRSLTAQKLQPIKRERGAREGKEGSNNERALVRWYCLIAVPRFQTFGLEYKIKI
jgi:hypothetical protein